MAFDQQSSMSNISGHTCTVVLAGNDTFLTETITQDRKRSITPRFPIVGGRGGGHPPHLTIFFENLPTKTNGPHGAPHPLFHLKIKPPI